MASAILALVGAFTLVGTVAAILLGLAALVHVARHRDRVGGWGLATFGILAGVGFTALTLYSLFPGEVLGLSGLVRRFRMAEQVDTTGPQEILRFDKGFAITRPAPRWGQAFDNQTIDDPAVDELHAEGDLLLVDATRYAFVDVTGERMDPFLSLDKLEAQYLGRFPLGQKIPGRNNPFRVETRVPLSPSGSLEGRELVVHMRLDGQPWKMLIRLYRARDGWLYVVRGFTLRRRYALVEGDFRKAMDSFRIITK
jgi:hypothetical protein